MFAFMTPKPKSLDDGLPACARCGQDCYGLPPRAKLDPTLIPYCSVACLPVREQTRLG